MSNTTPPSSLLNFKTPSQEESIEAVKEMIDYPCDIVAMIYESQVKEIMKLNQHIRNLGNDKIDQLFKESAINKLVEEQRRKTASKQFEWTYSAADVISMRGYTEVSPSGMKYMYIFPKNTPNLGHFKYNNSLATKIFSLEMIKQYMPYMSKKFGKAEYDESFRLQGEMIFFLYYFHLKTDFRFLRMIDISKIKAINPLTRINIRESNIKEQIMEKYINIDFNVKELIFHVLMNFFPNVTWRYVGAGHYLSLTILMITRMFFEYGLWDIGDTYRISRILLEKIVNLSTLEDACLNDIKGPLKSNKSFTEALVLLFQDIRKNVAQILVHIVTLVNDECLKNDLSWPKCTLPKESWKTVHFKNNEIFTTCSNILFTYLINGGKLSPEDIDANEDIGSDDGIPFDQKPTSFFVDMLLLIFCDKEKDIFIESNALITNPIFDYYVHQNLKTNVETEAVKIKQSFVDLINDYRDSKFGNIEEIQGLMKELKERKTEENNSIQGYHQYQSLFGTIKRLSLCAIGFIEKHKENQQNRFHAQMMLVDQNLVLIILTLIDMINEITPLTVKYYLARCLKSICTKNRPAQAQLFTGHSQDLYNSFSRNNTFLSSFLSRAIFKDDHFIFSVNPDIFRQIINMYEALLKRVMGTTNSEEEHGDKPCRLIESEIEESQQLNLPYLISLYSYNILLADLLKNSSSSSNQRQYDLITQELLIKYIDPLFKNVLLTGDGGQADHIKWSNIKGFLLHEQTTPFLLAISSSTKLSTEQVNSLQLDLAYSFLRLLNTVSERYYYGSIYDLLKKYFNKMDEYDYLLGFKEGVFIRTELLKLSEKYNVCISNNILTQRNKILSPGSGMLTVEKFFHQREHDYSSETFLKHTVNTISGLSKLETGVWGDEAKKNYILEGVFPIVYKWFKSARLCFFIDEKTTSKNDLKNIMWIVDNLVGALNEQKDSINSILKTNFSISEEKIKEFKEVDNKTVFNYEYVEIDEVKFIEIFHLRRITKLVLDEIWNAYPIEKLFILKAFKKKSSLISEQYEIEGSTAKKHENESKGNRKLKKSKTYAFTEKNIDQQKNKIKSINTLSKQKLYDIIQLDYVMKKSATLESDSKENNLLVRYFTPASISATISCILAKLYLPYRLEQEFKEKNFEEILELEFKLNTLTNQTRDIDKEIVDLTTRISTSTNGDEKKQLDLQRYQKSIELKKISSQMHYIRNQKSIISSAYYTTDIQMKFFFADDYLMGYLKLLNQLIIYDIEGLKPYLYFMISQPEKQKLSDGTPTEEDQIDEFPAIFKEGKEYYDKGQTKKIETEEESEAFIRFNEKENERKMRIEELTKRYEEANAYYNSKLEEYNSGKATEYPQWDSLTKPGEYKKKDYVYLRQRNNLAISTVSAYMIQLFYFVKFKTFQSESQQEIWEIVKILGDIIKNLCENRAIYFKKAFRKITMLETGANESRNWNHVFGIYVNVEAWISKSNCWKNTDQRLCITDAPEHMHSMRWLVHFFTEFTNGPCPSNQRLVYLYRPDLFTGIINRVIDDVSMESEFYKLKLTILEYFEALMEGEGIEDLDKDAEKVSKDRYFVTKFLSNNLNITFILENIKLMLKRLFISRKMQTSRSYKTQIKYRYQKLVKAKIKEIEAGGGPLVEVSKKRFEWEQNRKPHLFENEKESIISSLMCEAAPFISFYELFDLYKIDPIFSQHPIMDFALKMFTILDTMSLVNEHYKGYFDSKRHIIKQLFGDILDSEDLRTDEQSILKFDSNVIDEGLSCLMLLMKISKKIEITVTKATSPDESINKLIYFPLIPQTFFLGNETKETFLREIDMDNKRLYFQKRFNKFIVEMEMNYQTFTQGKLLYYILSPDSIEFQRKICYVAGIVINLICLFSFKLSINLIKANRSLSGGSFDIVVFIMSIVFAAYSLLVTFLWLSFEARHEWNVQLEEFRLNYPFDNENTLANKIYILLYVLFKEKGSLNFLAHGIFCILGIFIDPVFHTLHLLMIVNLSTTAKYVLRATAAHIDQLLLTFILALFIIYSYSMLTANYYSDRFDNLDVGELDVCKNLFSCFLYVMNMGLRNGGGVSDSHVLYEYKNPRFGGKIVFDISFFAFVNVISLNIIFGIIIDTFGNMRTDADNRSITSFSNLRTYSQKLLPYLFTSKGKDRRISTG